MSLLSFIVLLSYFNILWEVLKATYWTNSKASNLRQSTIFQIKKNSEYITLFDAIGNKMPRVKSYPFFVSIVLLSYLNILWEVQKATYWAKSKASKLRQSTVF
jgi:hypothetical protein